MRLLHRSRVLLGVLGIVGALWGSAAQAQLFENLGAFGKRLDVGDPAVNSTWRGGREGPKSIASADFNGTGLADLATGNLDGTVTVYYNLGGGDFSPPVHLATGRRTLRGLIAADLTGDGHVDLAAAAPLDDVVVIFRNDGSGMFTLGQPLPTWPFARDLTAGDFNGDGTTDLVVAGSAPGAKQYRGNGDGTFTYIATVFVGPAVQGTRPVFTLQTLRPAGATRDSLVVTHAGAERIAVLVPDATGRLQQREEICTTGQIYSIAVGSITEPAETGALDIITASRFTGAIEVHRNDPQLYFEDEPIQELAIPGGPRALDIVDLDGDGWNDVVVALRCLDRVMSFRNDNGTLVPVTELPVGRSPRQLAEADYNQDGSVDFAVINRVSSDVSIVTGSAGNVSFQSTDQVYPVDGGVSDMFVTDVNGDGRDDVLQLHRASSDASVRIAGSRGELGAATFYSMGVMPNALRVVDLNGDGHVDLVSANIGRSEVEPGTIAVRLGDGTGAFGDESKISPPEEVGGKLFAIEVADFDGDGNLDVVAGFFDCRIGFFRGLGDGSFEFTNVHFFLYEPRALVAGDFDGDGDMDLAGGSFTGKILIIENHGDLLTTAELDRTEYESPTPGKFGTKEMTAADANGDGDLDLFVASGHGVMLYHGGEGVTFELVSHTLPGTAFPSSSMSTADFDANGRPDLVVACQVLSCITILVQNSDGDYVPAIGVDVPAGRLIRTGDVDGDGHADIIGSGVVLWTVLSSRRPEPSDSRVSAPRPAISSGPLINELLAKNNRYPVDLNSNMGQRSDWLELYNSSDEPAELSGWKLMLQPSVNPEGDPPSIYEIPTLELDPHAHKLICCSRTLRSEFHTGFRLPASGGTLTLFDSSGNERDRVFYPRQQSNVSYARFQDGARSFTYNNYPSPEASNQHNGPVPPVVSLDRVITDVTGEAEPFHALTPGEPIRFYAQGEDDVGIVSVSVLWQRVDVPDPEQHRVILYDDGFHNDGGMQDGIFSGTLDEGLPAGASIRYQIEVRDLSDSVTMLPDSRAPSLGTGSDGFYTLSMDEGESPLEISEVVVRNDTGLKDETGGTPDWVEVRNCGDRPQPLHGLLLGTTFPVGEEWYRFPDTTLEPGEFALVYCDSESAQGHLHADFNLPSKGGTLAIVATNSHGAHWAVDSVEYPAMEPDTSYARESCGGAWNVSSTPTPGSANQHPESLPGDTRGDGSVDISDAITIFNYLFGGGTLPCRGAADTNGDGSIDVSDGIYLLLYLFGGGSPPVGAGC